MLRKIAYLAHYSDDGDLRRVKTELVIHERGIEVLLKGVSEASATASSIPPT